MVLSGTEDELTAIEAVCGGAQDYLVKSDADGHFKRVSEMTIHSGGRNRSLRGKAFSIYTEELYFSILVKWASKTISYKRVAL